MAEFTFVVVALLTLLVVAAPIIVLVRLLSRGKRRFCPDCGYEGRAGSKVSGSLLLEIVLWLLFIVPGLIYSVWRTGTRRPACSMCGSERLVPPNSPIALQFKAKLAGGPVSPQA